MYYIFRRYKIERKIPQSPLFMLVFPAMNLKHSRLYSIAAVRPHNASVNCQITHSLTLSFKARQAFYRSFIPQICNVLHLLPPDNLFRKKAGSVRSHS